MNDNNKLSALIALANYGLVYGNSQLQKDAKQLLTNLNSEDTRAATLKQFSEGDIQRMVKNLNQFAKNKFTKAPKFDAFGRTNS